MNTQNDSDNQAYFELLAANYKRLYLEYKLLAEYYEWLNGEQAATIADLFKRLASYQSKP